MEWKRRRRVFFNAVKDVVFLRKFPTASLESSSRMGNTHTTPGEHSSDSSHRSTTKSSALPTWSNLNYLVFLDFNFGHVDNAVLEGLLRNVRSDRVRNEFFTTPEETYIKKHEIRVWVWSYFNHKWPVSRTSGFDVQFERQEASWGFGLWRFC